jgi:uncharacterized protein YndB with AHSA1/START domain
MAQGNPIEDKPSLAITRHYPVAPEKVWRAWTDPQALSRWFGPGEMDTVIRAELDVRVGGRYRIEFRTASRAATRTSRAGIGTLAKLDRLLRT